MGILQESSWKGRSEMSSHVFLSHSTVDKTAVEELARRLNKEGIQAWLAFPLSDPQVLICQRADQDATNCLELGHSGRHEGTAGAGVMFQVNI